jgi:hypothetical protein
VGRPRTRREYVVERDPITASKVKKMEEKT